MMKNWVKGILKFLRAKLLLSPILLILYLFMFILYNITLFIIQIPILLVVLLGFISIVSVKEYILP